MTDQKDESNFEARNRKLRKQRLDKLTKRKKEILAKRREIDETLEKYSKRISRNVQNIGKNSQTLINNLRVYFGTEENMPIGAIDDFNETTRPEIDNLEKDLRIVYEGFRKDCSYISKTAPMRGRLEELRSSLDEEIKLLKEETKIRESIETQLEGKTQELEKFTEEMENKTEEFETRLEKLKGQVEQEKSDKELLRKVFWSLFDHNFQFYMLKGFAEFEIPKIDTSWEDNGIDYIFESGLYEFSDDDDLLKMIKSRKSGKEVVLKDVRNRERFDEFIKKISSYVISRGHKKNLADLIRRIQHSRQVLKNRGLKELYWCGDASRQCFFYCPGFTQTEKYCKVEKTKPYNKLRLGFLDSAFDEAYKNLRIADGIENQLIVRNKKSK